MKVFSLTVIWGLASLLPALPLRADTPGDSTGVNRLSAMSEPAWVPAEPVRDAELWESVLRAPGYVLSLPLQLLGRATESGLIYVEEEDVIPRLLTFLAFNPPLGIAVLPASLGDGSGLGGSLVWGPPGLRRHLVGEISGSTSQYNREGVAAFFGPLRAVYTSEWRPREHFTGIGMGFSSQDESQYAVRSQSVRLVVVFPDRPAAQASMRLVDGAIVRPASSAYAPVRTNLRIWAGPAETFVTNGRERDDPSFETIFPDVGAIALNRRVEHLEYGARVSHDRRFGTPRWRRGWRASVSGERHDRSVEAIALKNAHSDARSFSRISYHAEAGHSLGTDPRTVRVEVNVVDQTLDQSGGAFLIPDYMALGGSRGLAGFEPGRFHDIDLVLGRLSYLFPLGKNLEFAWAMEAGGVFPHLGAVRMNRLETSYSGRLRVRTDEAMAGAVGLAWSREAVRFSFSVGGVE